MKTWLVLLFAIMMIAPSSAQLAAWEDDAGDHTLTYNPVNDGTGAVDVPNEMGWYPDYDILRAGIHDETADEIQFELVLAAEHPTGLEPDYIDMNTYQLYFTYHGESMRIQVFWYHEYSDEPWSWVERLEGDYWQYMTYVETLDHPTDEGWVLSLAKWELRDLDLIPAREGDEIGNIWAASGRSPYDWRASPVPSPLGFTIGNFCFEPSFVTGSQEDVDYRNHCGIQPKDNAGTADSPLGSYVLTQSPEGLGHILLEVDRPVRSSNGLATTYVYELRLYNLDDEPDSVNLAPVDVPSGWDVYLPPRIDMEAGEITDIRMAIGVPFGHKHGEFNSLEIQAISERDPDTPSTAMIGVYWPQIAQPSGHHPMLYFHADGYRRWMNSVQGTSDPDDDGTGVLGGYSASGCGICVRNDDEGNLYPDMSNRDYIWHAYLRPGLFTGLDFEVDRPIQGNLDLAIDMTLDTTLYTALTLDREFLEPIVIATQTQDVSFVAGEPQSIAISMPVDAAADRIPYDDNSALYFTIFAESQQEGVAESNPENTGSVVFGRGVTSDMEYVAELYAEASYLDLPLLDYHDDVDQGLLDSLTQLQLEAPEEISRPTNPGKTLAFYFEVLNKGDNDDTVDWHIEGPHADWATVVPDSSDVDGLDKATVAIRIDVPADEPQDSVADLLLVGQSRNNPDAQVFGRFQAYVETDVDIPDESDRFLQLMDTAAETEANRAPGPTIPLLLAGVAVAALARRRS